METIRSRFATSQTLSGGGVEFVKEPANHAACHAQVARLFDGVCRERADAARKQSVCEVLQVGLGEYDRISRPAKWKPPSKPMTVRSVWKPIRRCDGSCNSDAQNCDGDHKAAITKGAAKASRRYGNPAAFLASPVSSRMCRPVLARSTT